MMLVVNNFRLDATSISKLVDLRLNFRTIKISFLFFISYKATLKFKVPTMYQALISKKNPRAAKMQRKLNILNNDSNTTIIKKKKRLSVVAQFVSQML